MSSPPSSSSSNSQRTARRTPSDSDGSKLQIRVVPYSPPRLGEKEGESSSRARPSGVGSDKDRPANLEPFGNPFQKASTGSSTGSESRGKESHQGASLSPQPSPKSPASSLATVKGKGVSGSKLGSDSSGAEHPAPPATPAHSRSSYGSSIRHVNAPSSQYGGTASPASSWKQSQSVSREINVHSDKTFSVVLRPTNKRASDKSGSTLRSPIHSYASTASQPSSHERVSFDVPTDDPSSPLSSLTDRSVSPYTPGYPAASSEIPADHIGASPWNYRMVGGLRKVPNNPEASAKGKEKEQPTRPLPPLPETTVTLPSPEQESPPPLSTKQSFASEVSESTIGEAANYKIIRESPAPTIDEPANYEVIERSPTDSENSEEDSPIAASSPNYRVFGQSSPAQTVASSSAQPPVDTPASQQFFDTPFDTPASQNFVVHGDPSPAPSVFTPSRRPRAHTSADSLVSEVRQQYSQESLRIAPLRPRRQTSAERFGYYKQHSRESLRGRAHSLSSASSFVSLDSAATPNVVRLHNTPSISSIRRPERKLSWAQSSSGPSRQPRMEEHQWSSQLSTVPSENESSERGSRLLSRASNPDRTSSGFGSRHSRHMRSISSSILENLEVSPSHSRSNSRTESILDRPSPTYVRSPRELPSPPIRTVRDHDEHGDGLADLDHLQQLQSKSSRSRLGFSRRSSNHSMRSSVGSITSATIPAWARVYYGSGERRWLASPSIRSDGGDSRPGSAFGPSASPSQQQGIRNPRRRPRDLWSPDGRPSSMEISPIQGGLGTLRQGPKKKTSSIWSPHLRRDRRASGYSMWQPPSVSWSAESGMFGKRNIQVVMFVVGFVFPFAWMIAAFLPLPPKPSLEMQVRDQSTTQFYIPEEPIPFQSRIACVDDSRFQSARWWRNLNRFMSIIGLLILGAVIALVVIGLRENWS
ncbi:hypothetical protein F4780DRAFT_789517 [Xylariomycetidae sp. FL0641]|nr:hypothetical protein F4780DRAFT_789517 [Xylariomycetidae sp. FL0641]